MMRLLALATATVLSLTVAASDGEEPYIRSFFYAGGEYVDDGSGGNIFRGQMYVEKLVPVGGVIQTTPVVLIHGQAQTGSNFLNKPDGGCGWASQFVRQGYEVYVVDQTLRARSAWQPGYGAASPSTYPAEILQRRFTAPARYGLWPQAANHTQWPGAGVMGDPVFDAFYASNVQFGGTLPLLLADARPSLAAGLVLLEPTGPPFREAVFGDRPARPYGLADVPLAYDPPVSDPAVDLVREERPARDGDGASSVRCVLQAEHDPAPRRLVNLADKGILIVTGEASYHMQYDYCTAEFLRQAGCGRTEHVELGERGIHGNGHMFFMERNSDQIQALVHDWIQRLD
ncbi:hypothetical protein RB594_003835 [Gaeumannomyces avenae]